jgi:hypothetical protein
MKGGFMSRLKLKNYDPDKITVVKEMRDYRNAPFVKKKGEKALESIKKYGLPEPVRKKKK